MDFKLFILLNAVLFIRPSELYAPLAPWPIYYALIVANLLFAWPAIINHFQYGLSRIPVTACVLWFFLGIVLSALSNGHLWLARMGVEEFSKVLAYYLILVSTVTNPARFRALFLTTAVFATVTSAIAVLQFNGVVDFGITADLYQKDSEDEHAAPIRRLIATGVFSDPNDLSMILALSIFIYGYVLTRKNWGPIRFLSLVPIGFLLYAMMLTQSRGGILALIAGTGIFFYLRFGMKRTLIAMTVGMTVLLTALKSRQTDFMGALTTGTGQSRADLWREGLQMIKASPLFGVGFNNYEEHALLVAHNSFLHCFAELGLFGGGAFLGVFYVAARSLHGIHRVRKELPHDLAGLYPFVFATLVAFLTSLLSLSRPYENVTFLVAGFGSAFCRFPALVSSYRELKFDGRLVARIYLWSFAYIAAIYVFLRLV